MSKVLSAAVDLYLIHSLAATARYEARMSEKAARVTAKETTKQVIAQEQQQTKRARVHADLEIQREREFTQRETARFDAEVLLMKEKRIAFVQLCDTLKEGVRAEGRGLENLRAEFSVVCQVLIERDLPADERRALLSLLESVLKCQQMIMQRQEIGLLESHDLFAQFLDPNKYLSIMDRSRLSAD